MTKKLLIILLFLIILTGCQMQDPAVLYPENIRIMNEVLLWDDVEDATSYTVSINDETHKTTELSFDLNYLENGTYQIKIMTHKDLLSSRYTPVMTYTLARDYTAPQNVSITDGIFLTWDIIEFATSYTIFIDDIESATTLVNSYDLSILTFSTNTLYKIEVVGHYGVHQTLKSDSIAYHNYVSLDLDIQETYTLNQQTPLTLSFSNPLTIDQVLLGDVILPASSYTYSLGQLEIDHSIFESLDLGVYELFILTTTGSIKVTLTVMNPERPYMISDGNVEYTEQDIVLEFNLIGGLFNGLSGNGILESDYDFEGSTLTINSSYVENILSSNPDRETIILTYLLKKDTHTVIGYIFINIP